MLVNISTGIPARIVPFPCAIHHAANLLEQCLVPTNLVPFPCICGSVPIHEDCTDYLKRLEFPSAQIDLRLRFAHGEIFSDYR